MFRFILLISISSLIASHGQQTKAWPTVLKGRGVAPVILPSNQEPPFIYLSKNFKFISNSKIDSTKIAAFAATAESVPAAVARIPLELKHLPKLADGENRHPIYIAADEEEYIKNGGSKNSAGYYSGQKKAVILRADKFLNKKRPDYRLLTHELVHLTMHGINGKTNAWFTEGNAEYFASAFYGKSSYKFSSMSTSIKARTKWFYKPGDTIKLHSLEEFITRDSKKWREINNDLAPENRYNQYMTALLLIHYFYHIDPSGREKIATYLTLVKDGKKEISDQSHLFPEGQTEKIQKSITKHWKLKGYQILFEDLSQ